MVPAQRKQNSLLLIYTPDYIRCYVLQRRWPLIIEVHPVGYCEKNDIVDMIAWRIRRFARQSVSGEAGYGQPRRWWPHHGHRFWLHRRVSRWCDALPVRGGTRTRRLQNGQRQRATRRWWPAGQQPAVSDYVVSGQISATWVCFRRWVMYRTGGCVYLND